MNVEKVRYELWKQGVPHDTLTKFINDFEERPDVWRAFERFANEAANKGKRIGAKAIMERVRWEVEVVDGGDFKVNNNYTSYYARVFELKNTRHEGFFEKREIKGLGVAA